MQKHEIPFLTATDLAGLIANQEVSPVEVVEAYLERIDGLNARLNAFLTLCREEALQAARAAERAIARGEYRGLMHGIPFAVKDQLYTKGIRTTGGSPIFNQFIPDADATVIARLTAAGAILLGKLNMTEFGTTGFSHRFETPRNPWDLERYTGGSSSGSGAATAAFLCATSLGEDTGGSIRVRVGVVREQLYSDQVEPAIREAVLKAAGVLQELGASLEEVSIPLSAHAAAISGGLRVEAPMRYRELLRSRLQEIGHDNRIGYLTGSLLPAQAYYKAQKLRALLRQQVLQALERVDVLVQPTSGKTAQKIEPDPLIDSKEKANRLSALLTTTYSLANTPALSLPCGFASSPDAQAGNELPIGLQIAGRPFDEETVLRVAYAYEQRTPWHARRPPL
ncbi:MAG: amidase [Nitrospinae bacterium]|nr:amidase [Nitrospinota bacterium]